MDFSKLKDWQIPEGKVKSVSVGGVVIWKAEPELEQLAAPTMYLSKNNVEINSQDFNTEDFEIFIDGVLVGDLTIPYITFAIDGTEYKAIDGMGWGEFVNSVYNLGLFRSINNKVYYNEFQIVGVVSEDKIEANKLYTVDKSITIS